MIFPILLFLGYNVISLFSGDNTIEEDTKKEVAELNTDLPSVSIDKTGIKSKYQAMASNFGKITDHTSVNSVEQEVKEDPAANIQSVYTDREKQMLDSIDAEREKEKQNFSQELERLQHLAERNNGATEARVNVDDERLEDNPAARQFREQMILAQKISNGEKILTREEEEAEARRKEIMAYKKMLRDSIEKANAPIEVNKAVDSNEQYFNSIKDGDDRPGLIKARIDEMVKVKDGSRIRIRLSEDVEIGGDILERGSYLYAIVEGFSAQRVKAKVSQALVNGRIRKVDLSVYDLDCIEGFFVPNSSFRELARNIGAGAIGNIQIQNDTNEEQNLQSIAMQSLQQAVQATTQAVSKNIRQNKAKIKYNTEVYLVNSKDIK